MDMKYRLIGLACLLVLAEAVAVQATTTTTTTTTGTGGITNALTNICTTIKAIVPIVALLMFIIAGAVYAAGQVMGAETRARANVWSTAMLVGGIIGLIIAASAPYFVNIFSQFTLGSTGTYAGGTSVSC